MTTQGIAAIIDCTITIGLSIWLVLARPRIVAKILDPQKRARTDKLLRIAGPFAIVGGALTALSQIHSFEDRAEQAARFLNNSQTKMIDPITRFDGATAGPGERVVIEETIISITADQYPKAKWEALVPKIREKLGASNVAKLTGQGITVVIRYNDRNGLFIGEVVLTPTVSKKT